MRKNKVLLFCFLCFVSGLACGIGQTTASSVRKFCMPNMAVVGKSPDESISLLEKVGDEGAVLPSAVEVLIEEKRLTAVTAKYFGSDISFKEVSELLTARHGPSLLKHGAIDTDFWKLTAQDGRKLQAYLHKQGPRVTVVYREDTQAEDEAINDALKRLPGNRSEP